MVWLLWCCDGLKDVAEDNCHGDQCWHLAGAPTAVRLPKYLPIASAKHSCASTGISSGKYVRITLLVLSSISITPMKTGRPILSHASTKVLTGVRTRHSLSPSAKIR